MSMTFVREVNLSYRGPRRGLSYEIANCPEKAADFLRKVFPDNVREHFVVLFLDTKRQVVAFYVAATGTGASCPVGLREIFQAAVTVGAGSLIVGHNHPTDDPSPSLEDRAVTARLADGGKLLGIPLVDHLIVGATSFYSFHERGDLEAPRPGKEPRL